VKALLEQLTHAQVRGQLRKYTGLNKTLLGHSRGSCELGVHSILVLGNEQQITLSMKEMTAIAGMQGLLKRCGLKQNTDDRLTMEEVYRMQEWYENWLKSNKSGTKSKIKIHVKNTILPKAEVAPIRASASATPAPADMAEAHAQVKGHGHSGALSEN
jgi:hypothetical protein